MSSAGPAVISPQDELMIRDAAARQIGRWWLGLQDKLTFSRLKRAMSACVSVHLSSFRRYQSFISKLINILERTCCGPGLGCSKSVHALPPMFGFDVQRCALQQPWHARMYWTRPALFCLFALQVLSFFFYLHSFSTVGIDNGRRGFETTVPCRGTVTV